jgi:molecular chaperone DnaK (HSP70)
MRNTTIPTKKSVVTLLSTESPVFRIFEGERLHCHDNNLLSEMQLPSTPNNSLMEATVTMDLDANGILTCHVLNMETSQHTKTVVTNDKVNKGLTVLTKLGEIK